MKMSFRSHADKTHFHMKGFARGLALKRRHNAIRKWPILALYLSIGFSFPARYKLITPFKTAIAHTLNEETEDPKNSLNKELSVHSSHARKADTSGSRNMTLPDLAKCLCFRYQAGGNPEPSSLDPSSSYKFNEIFTIICK